MPDQKLASAQEVIRECFWGDYTLSVPDFLSRLESNDPGFHRFVFSKIIENSRHPSRHLRNLFSNEQVLLLLTRYLQQTRDQKRVRLIAANITGNYALAPEYAWRQ